MPFHLGKLDENEFRITRLIISFSRSADFAASLLPTMFGTTLTRIAEEKDAPFGRNPTGDSFYRFRGSLLFIRIRNISITLAPCRAGVNGFEYWLLTMHWLRNRKYLRPAFPLANLGRTLTKLHNMGAIETRDSYPFVNLFFVTPALLHTLSRWEAHHSWHF